MSAVSKALLSLLMLTLCVSAAGAPAAWFMWSSVRDGEQVCMQTSPGEGWERIAGPFKNAQCTVEGMPGH